MTPSSTTSVADSSALGKSQIYEENGNAQFNCGIGLSGLTWVAGCSTQGGLQVGEVGSYHIGGRALSLEGLPQREVAFTPGAPPLKVDPNGDFEVEQMYVRYTRLANPRSPYPLLMWHGGGLCGVTFETKPDAKPGWESFFLRAGYDVYVSDAVERGRASWARFPEVFRTEPFFRPKREAWELFRIGDTGSYTKEPGQRKALPGAQFPIESFDQMAKQVVPRWATNDAATQAAYDTYVSKQCPCIILVHSQGANFAFNSSLKYPEHVKALVVIEPSGSPDPEKTDFSRIKSIPMLWVWGDNLDRYPFCKTIHARQERFRFGLQAAGGIGDQIALPALGVRGNSHMLMMDRNSDQIAELIQQWAVAAVAFEVGGFSAPRYPREGCLAEQPGAPPQRSPCRSRALRRLSTRRPIGSVFLSDLRTARLAKLDLRVGHAGRDPGGPCEGCGRRRSHGRAAIQLA